MISRRISTALATTRGAVAVAVATLASAAGQAAAAPCADLNLPKPIYGTGGSATRPLMAKLGTALANQPDPVTLLYQGPGACFSVYNLLRDAPLTGSINYWDKAGQQQSCELPPVNGPRADFGVMVSSHKLCADAPAALPPTIGDFAGPVESFNFFVPRSSPADAISAAAAYFVFGFGKVGGVEPWVVDDSFIIKRDVNSAAAQYIGIAINVPVAKFKGRDAGTNERSIAWVAEAATPRGAIGFASGSVYDAARASVKALAYQHTGQSCGYLPDSSPTSFDKKNVREGRYFIWGAQHFYARVDPATKAWTNPNVRRALGMFTGDEPVPAGIDLLKLTVESGAVPQCAMKVQRDGDLTEIKPYAAPEPCGCYFEQVANKATSCTPCQSDAQCGGATPKCRRGFCEAR
jgi:ABC-type phosphate transport system substrate-binding protein